ncbi:MAG: molecular chaperone TorD family protein [Bacillota bacterium]
MTKEIILQWLEGREVVYAILGMVFYRGPEENVLSSLLENDFLRQLGESMDDQLIDEGCTQMHNELKAKFQDDQYKKALWEEYNRFFVGPGPLEAPPWESVYRSKERLIFGSETLSVRKFYQDFGLAIKDGNREPDDHIGLELEFMAFLSKQAWELKKADGDISHFMEASKRFMKEHLQEWVADLCRDLETKASKDFFKGLAKLTKGWVELDGASLVRWETESQ